MSFVAEFVVWLIEAVISWVVGLVADVAPQTTPKVRKIVAWVFMIVFVGLLVFAILYSQNLL